jgi:hypothetical protein
VHPYVEEVVGLAEEDHAHVDALTAVDPGDGAEHGVDVGQGAHRVTTGSQLSAAVSRSSRVSR